MAEPITDWTADRLSSLAGKHYLITGGNSGIGFEAARTLLRAGADVTIACRSMEKAEQACKSLSEAGLGKVDSLALDLSRMSSVRSAASHLLELGTGLDALINNAGIMQTPQTRTEDGFELQLATNHLGHFLLNALVYPLVRKRSGRIVTVSSLAHRFGKIHFDDLMLTDNYDPTTAYSQSKLANLLYAQALHHRLVAANSPVMSVACHPGYSATALQSTGPFGLWKLIYGPANALFAQSADRGALPTVLAAAGKEAVSAGFYGPQKFGEARGPVGDAKIAEHAKDRDAMEKLWTRSEDLVGEPWPDL